AGALPPRLRSLKPLPKRRKADTTQKLGPDPLEFSAGPALNTAQATSVHQIAASLGTFEAFLLYGITGSGKTEVYLHLISRLLATGKQALVLVPEIGLTPQLEARFRRAFPGAAIAVLHSALEDTARTHAWLAAARGDAAIVLGTRLAVLTPMPRLGAVVV